MVNTVKKGNRRQLQARKLLEAEGWLVYTAPRLKYGPVDIWGLWDIIAYRNGYIKLVQCKSNYCSPEVKRRIKEFLTDGVFVMREVWVYKDWSRLNPWVTKIR